MGEAFAVSLEADQAGEARVAVHGRKAELEFLPAHKLVETDAAVDAERLRPVAGKTVGVGLGEQVGEGRGCPTLGTEEPLQQRHPADVVVVKVADERHVDAVDATLLAQCVQAVQQRPPAIGLGIGRREETPPGIVAIVDHQCLAGLADEEPVDALRFRRAPDMFGHLLQRRAVGSGDLGRLLGPPGAEGLQILLQLRQRCVTVVEHGHAEAGQQRVSVSTAQVCGRIVRCHCAAEVVVVVLKRRHPRHPAWRMDGLAAAHGAQVGPGHGEGQATLGDGDARQGHDLHLKPAQLEVRIVVEHACQRDRLDGGEEIPVVVVDDISVPLAEVLERVGEDRLFTRWRVDRNAPLRCSGCARRVIAEEVGANQRAHGRGQPVQFVKPLARAGIHDQRTLGAEDGIDVTTVWIEIDIG